MARASASSAHPSSPLSSSSSEAHAPARTHLKRKHDADTDSDSEPESISSSSSSSSSSESLSAGPSHDRSSPKQSKATKKDTPLEKKKQALITSDKGEEDDVQVLSHKDQRKLKKKQKLPRDGLESTAEKKKTDSKEPVRQNSVWVGNLSFRTTPDALRKFFADAGETTRVHMPTKAIHGTKIEGAMRGENRGFAYVDFETPEAKAKAVAMSEKNLDGRRLLIKDGGDFSGRPVASNNESETSAIKPSGPSTGLSRTAQKILNSQKQPPCPCLFLGNLGFETTDESVREMFERNAKSRDRWAQKEKSKGKKMKENTDLAGDEEGSDDGEDRKEEKKEKGSGVRKVRLGTFEDSGNCKGFGFVDFETIAQATAALINPYNHNLDGRSLVVEYASADAARRGGYRPPAAEGEASTGKLKGKPKMMKRKNAGTNDRQDHHGSASFGTHENQENDLSDEPPWKRQRDGESAVKKDYVPIREMANSKHRRSKPGAALAMAKRESVAIVPSTGTRLTFT